MLFLESWKPADTEGKKQYDREFLLDFQFMPACIQKPEGLPPISDVVLDKVNRVLREWYFFLVETGFYDQGEYVKYEQFLGIVKPNGIWIKIRNV